MTRGRVSPAARLQCSAETWLAEPRGEQHDPNQLGGGRVGELGTHGAAAGPARWVDPSATAPRRWSHPYSASFPSRSARRCSTRPRRAPRWGKRTSPDPGQQHRHGWLGAALLKGVSGQSWDITLIEYSFVYYPYTWLLAAQLRGSPRVEGNEMW